MGCERVANIGCGAGTELRDPHPNVGATLGQSHRQSVPTCLLMPYGGLVPRHRGVQSEHNRSSGRDQGDADLDSAHCRVSSSPCEGRTVYPNDALIEVLAPAYEPCRHMPVCGGRCRQSHWEPANGHMPRGFLGATGELDEIELVIVLAEPGDPKGTEKYLDELAPSDTVRRVVDFVHETYVNQEDRRVHGKVQRVIRWFSTTGFAASISRNSSGASGSRKHGYARGAKDRTRPRSINRAETPTWRRSSNCCRTSRSSRSAKRLRRHCRGWTYRQLECLTRRSGSPTSRSATSGSEQSRNCRTEKTRPLQRAPEHRNGPRELDSVVSEIFLGFQPAKSRRTSSPMTKRRASSGSTSPGYRPDPCRNTR